MLEHACCGVDCHAVYHHAQCTKQQPRHRKHVLQTVSQQCDLLCAWQTVHCCEQYLPVDSPKAAHPQKVCSCEEHTVWSGTPAMLERLVQNLFRAH